MTTIQKTAGGLSQNLLTIDFTKGRRYRPSHNTERRQLGYREQRSRYLKGTLILVRLRLVAYRHCSKDGNGVSGSRMQRDHTRTEVWQFGKFLCPRRWLNNKIKSVGWTARRQGTPTRIVQGTLRRIGRKKEWDKGPTGRPILFSIKLFFTVLAQKVLSIFTFVNYEETGWHLKT